MNILVHAVKNLLNKQFQFLNKMKREKKEIKAINCEEAVIRFNEFMDNYLKGKTRKELVHHINECKHCFQRFEFEQMLKSKVQKLAKKEKNNSLISKIEKMIASI